MTGAGPSVPSIPGSHVLVTADPVRSALGLFVEPMEKECFLSIGFVHVGKFKPRAAYIAWRVTIKE